MVSIRNILCTLSRNADRVASIRRTRTDHRLVLQPRRVSSAMRCLQQRRLCRTPPTRTVQRLDDRLRIVRGDLQQRERRPIGRATALLPIPQRCDANPNHQRELRLRLIERGTQRFYIRRIEGRRARGLPRTAADRAHLADAGQQLIECVSLHLNFSRTTRVSARSCVDVRSPCSFFACI